MLTLFGIDLDSTWYEIFLSSQVSCTILSGLFLYLIDRNRSTSCNTKMKESYLNVITSFCSAEIGSRMYVHFFMIKGFILAKSSLNFSTSI